MTVGGASNDEKNVRYKFSNGTAAHAFKSEYLGWAALPLIARERAALPL